MIVPASAYLNLANTKNFHDKGVCTNLYEIEWNWMKLSRSVMNRHQS